MGDEVSGIQTTGRVLRNRSAAELIELATCRDESLLAASGALVALTGERAGRSPKDKFFVRHGDSAKQIAWSATNQGVDPEVYDALFDRARGHLADRDLFVVDGYIGADPEHRIRLRVICELAWQALFARQLFRRLEEEELEGFEPEFTVVAAPGYQCRPERDHTNTNAFVGLDLERKQVLICGTYYAGEIKKSLFTAANYLMPQQGVLPMHCSANLSDHDGVAVFFGLSGTGKTTISADPERRLIGDDEHGWSDDGIFNFEGGCYAKCINLSEDKEPQIWNAITFGSVVENVVMDPQTRVVDFNDDSLTENTRAAYPLEMIPGYVPEGRGGHAESIVFLTADAFGVLPPISILNPAAAAYHYLSGFTAKLAGTEAGMSDEPEATFSTCFGAPFLPMAPGVYAKMLEDRMRRHRARAFLLNTGWTGGPYGVGSRIDLEHTRAMVRAALSGALEGVETRMHPVFNLEYPLTCPGVPDEILDPRQAWDDPEAYETQAKELARMFVENFERFSGEVPPEVVEAGPKAS